MYENKDFYFRTSIWRLILFSEGRHVPLFSYNLWHINMKLVCLYVGYKVFEHWQPWFSGSHPAARVVGYLARSDSRFSGKSVGNLRPQGALRQAMCPSLLVPCLFTLLFPIHFLFLTGKGGVPSASSNAHRDWNSCTEINVTRSCSVFWPQRGDLVFLSLSSQRWFVEVCEWDLNWVCPRTILISWLVAEEVTTGHRTDMSLTPQGHVHH